MEYFRQLFVSRLRNANANILSRKAGQESAERNELHFAVVYIDNDTAAETVVPMHEGVEQRFTNGLFGIVLLIRANNALDRGNGFVAQSEVIDRILELLENRTAELLTVPELGAKFVVEYSNLSCVKALVGKKQCEVGVEVILCDAQGPILFGGKLNAVALKCRRR